MLACSSEDIHDGLKMISRKGCKNMLGRISAYVLLVFLPEKM